MSKKVAIQGYAASFHDVAARRLFGQDIEIIGCDTFADVFLCVLTGKADGGVVAIINSNYGDITESLDLFNMYEVTQLERLVLPIEQCLIGFAGTTLQDLREVHSHPVALVQCSSFLNTVLAGAKQCENADTAGSVADVQRWHDTTKAAIASRAAADLYGLHVLVAGIENDPSNATTFVSFVKPRQ